jgi:hypothetical protein
MVLESLSAQAASLRTLTPATMFHGKGASVVLMALHST